MRLASAALLAGLTLAAPAAAASFKLGGLQADHPWIRATPPGAMTAAGYLTLTNKGPKADQLVGGSTPAARSLTVHQSIEAGGMMRMAAVKALPLAPGASVVFKPGGYHLMLTGLTGPLKVGQSVPVTLQFTHGGRMRTQFIVEQTGPAPDMAGMPGMH